MTPTGPRPPPARTGAGEGPGAHSPAAPTPPPVAFQLAGPGPGGGKAAFFTHVRARCVEASNLALRPAQTLLTQLLRQTAPAEREQTLVEFLLPEGGPTFVGQVRGAQPQHCGANFGAFEELGLEGAWNLLGASTVNSAGYAPYRSPSTPHPTFPWAPINGQAHGLSPGQCSPVGGHSRSKSLGHGPRLAATHHVTADAHRRGGPPRPPHPPEGVLG